MTAPSYTTSGDTTARTARQLHHSLRTATLR
jgi:hypothetical protein